MSALCRGGGGQLGPFMTGTMKVDVFAYASVAARTALLSWIGSHTDQARTPCAASAAVIWADFGCCVLRARPRRSR
jgi:hypothetical protein